MQLTSLVAVLLLLVFAPTPAQAGTFYVSDSQGIREYDSTTGAFIKLLSQDRVRGLLSFGPDGNLYMAVNGLSSIRRYNVASGNYIDDFASLPTPTGLAFGPDGNLYVSSINLDGVFRFDGATGASLGPFVSPGLADLNAPAQIKFGPNDGMLYVIGDDAFQILRFNGSTGAFVDKFLQDSTGKLHFPARGFTFGSDGNIYVGFLSQIQFGGNGSAGVARYSGVTGLFMDFFVTEGTGLLSSGSGPADVAFGPDHNLYVVGANNVVRYDGGTGRFIDVFVSGLDGPTSIAFAPAPSNSRPTCTEAQPFPANIWAPNHQFIPIAVMGVTDPDGDLVTITVTAVTQDEPVSNNTSPDAVIQSGAASVRAERSASGNGRVYKLSFRADDGKGGSCTGAVSVSVPHSLGKGLAALDDGQIYNSTLH